VIRLVTLAVVNPQLSQKDRNSNYRIDENMKKKHLHAVDNQSRIVTLGGPSKPFAGMIEKFMLLEGRDFEGQLHEVLPKSSFRLVFVINSTDCDLYFLGPNLKMRTHQLRDYFVVHFLPGMMPQLADLKPIELTENFIPLKKVLGTEASTLIDSIQTATSFHERQLFMEEFFRRSRLETVFRSGLSTKAVQMVRSCHGQIRVSDLAEHFGSNIRTIERTFLEHVGLSPKKFIRLIRFQSALQRMTTDESLTNLADLAYSCGFSDQSHLIKDFQDFTNRPPSRI
jgi:AraC-like DNA-binding protein